MVRERENPSLTSAMFIELIEASQSGPLDYSNANFQKIAPHLQTFCSQASAADNFIRGDREQLVDVQAFVDLREAEAALRTVGVSFKDISAVLQSTQTVLEAALEGKEASGEDLHRASLLIDGFNRRAEVGAYSFTREE